MNPLASPLHDPFPALVAAPLFTVGSALRWLGHVCSEQPCSSDIDELTASVWFVRRNHVFRTSPPETLVLVDAADTAFDRTRLLEIIGHVGECTRVDGIGVHDLRGLPVARSW